MTAGPETQDPSVVQPMLLPLFVTISRPKVGWLICHVLLLRVVHLSHAIVFVRHCGILAVIHFRRKIKVGLGREYPRSVHVGRCDGRQGRDDHARL